MPTTSDQMNRDAGSGTTGNLVEGNYLGTDPAGSAAVANGTGVLVSGAGGNTVGGTSGGARNVISGNVLRGVFITGSGTNSNVIAGNYVGTDWTGMSAVSNNNTGILVVSGAQNNVIGGNHSHPDVA